MSDSVAGLIGEEPDDVVDPPIDPGVHDGWFVRRSHLHSGTWVPIPYGFGDQSFALHCGPLRLVKAWVVEEHGAMGRETTGIRWRRLDEDTYCLTDHRGHPTF